jgi:hypothetical protein
MKRTFFLLVFCFSASLIFSQQFTYGVNGGVSNYDLETSEESGFYPIKQSDLGIHFGAFLDYSLTESFGIKTDVIINSLRDRYLNENNINSTFYVKVNSIQIAPKIKFYPKKEYNKGFYFLLGPRVTIITSVKDEDGKKIEDFYKGSNFGGQGGFGYNILNFLAVELLADVTVSDPLEFEYDSQKLFAAFINLNFNLESLINK